MRLLCSINFCFGSVEMRQFKNNCSGLKIDWGSPPVAAIYGMRITSLHFVVLHKIDNGVVSGTSGDLTDDCVSNFMSFYE